MTYVIAEPCIGVKDRACVDECPVDCIYEGPRMLYIQPDECVDCDACVPVCPVTAIFSDEDLPGEWKQFAAVNADGSLASARGATASTRVSDGTYDVTFGSDVSKCVYTANETTINDAGAVAVQAQSSTVIRVATRKGGGQDGTGPSDRQNKPFNLVVNC